MADTYVTFGADTGALEAGAAAVKAKMAELRKEMNETAREFSRTGAAADSEIGAKLKELGDKMATAKEKAREFGEEIRKAGAGANDNFRNLSAEFKGAAEKMSDAAWNYGPWSGHQVDMVKFGVLGLSNALSIAGAAFTAVGAAASAAIGVISAKMAELGDNVGKFAAEFGQTTESISGLGALAKRVGLETDALGKSLQDLHGNLKKDGDDDDFKKADYALRALGLTVDQIKGKNFQQTLDVIADAMKRTGDSANKTAAANALFGDEVAGKLLPALNRGSSYLDSWAEAAQRFGVALSGEMTARMQGTVEIMSGVGDAAHRLSMAFQGVGVAIYATFKPAVDGLLATFRDLLSNLADAIGWLARAAQESGALGVAMTALGVAFRSLVSAISLAVGGLQVFVATAVEVGTQVSNIFVGLARIVIAFAKDATDNAVAAFRAIYEVAAASASGIAQAFASARAAIKAALSLDFGSAKAAVDNIGSSLSGIGGKISAAMDLPGLRNTAAAISGVGATIKKDFGDYTAGVVRIGEQTKAQLETIWGSGARTERRAAQMREAGSPDAPEEAGAGRKSGAGDGARAAQAAIEGEIQAQRQALEQKKQLYAEAAKLKLISESEALARTKDAINQEYEAERALLQKELALDGMKEQQKQQVLNKLQQLEAKYGQEMMKLAGQQAQEIVKDWHRMVDSIASSLQSSIMGMITHTKKLSDAARDVAKAIVNEFVRMGVTAVAGWAKSVASRIALSLAGETQITAAVGAGAAARQGIEAGAETASIATKAASIMKSIMQSAGEAFAGVFGFLSPVMGPAAAGPAAAAQATVMSVAGGLFDVGAWEVDRDQHAFVHRKEMIMTAGQSEGLRNVIDLAKNAVVGGGGQGGSVSTGVHLNVQALDGRSVQRVLTGNGRALMKAIAQHARHGTALGMRGLAPV